MAGTNQVTLTMVGDTDQLEKAFDRVGAAADAMDTDVARASRSIGDSADSFDRVGDAADDLDTRAMGFRDTITGVQDTMGGWNQLMQGDIAGGLLTLGMGVGDLASGVANLIVPVVKSAATWVSSHTAMAASSISTAASAIASWVATAAASVANAAVVAASWLLAFAPVIIVVAIVIALVVVIIKNWDTIKAVIQRGWEFVKSITATVWTSIKAGVTTAINLVVGVIRRQIAVAKAIFRGLKTAVLAIFRAITSSVRTQLNVIKAVFRGFRSAVAGIFRAVGRAISRPIEIAVRAIKSVWNSTVGGKGISIPGIPGIFGGASFTIPSLAAGGVVMPRPGGTIVRLAEAGRPEAVVPLGSGRGPGAGPVVHVEINIGGSIHSDRAVTGMLADALRNAGIDQLLLEARR